MTQMVKKGSSWRTLRRKAVVGASSFALVAGMGVAIAPSAMAAVGNVAATNITATATLPETVAIANSSNAMSLQVANTHSNDFGIQKVTLTLAFSDPSITCGDVTVTAGTPSTSASLTSPTGQALTCVYVQNGGGTSTTAASAIATATASTPATLSYTLQVNKAAATGTVKMSAVVTDQYTTSVTTATTKASDTATANLAAPTAPSFVTTAPAAPVFGSSYAPVLVADAGFNGTTATSYKAIAYSKNATTGKWSLAATRTIIVDQVGSTPLATTSNNGEVTHNYISLNTDNFLVAANVSGTTASQTGYFFDTATGAVIFGTLSVTITGSLGSSDVDFTAGTAQFAAKPVTASGPAYTWTVVADNNIDVRATSTAANDGSNAVPGGLATDEAASPQFGLSFATFSDVADTNVFAAAIDALAGANIIKGYADGTYGPALKITRGEFAAISARMLAKIAPSLTIATGACSSTASERFSDVPNASIFCGEITSLAGLGVINGTSTTKFSPSALVTRDQVAAFVFRMNAVALGSAAADAPQAATAFTDVPASNFASGDIKWGSSNGIVKGRTATTFDPAGNTLRQEAAGMLYRLGQAWGKF